tara:strand:- start:1879 stop:2307 length:429 start_codon:yes stop_codon:yes gene_type:complete
MPLIELFFEEQSSVPASLQVGDTAYYVSGQSLLDLGEVYSVVTTSSNPADIFNSSDITEQQAMTTIGTVDEITVSSAGVYVICNISSDTTPPTTTDFILFAKDNEVNVSDLKGYFGKTKLINNSTEKAELYAISCEIAESSK